MDIGWIRRSSGIALVLAGGLGLAACSGNGPLLRSAPPPPAIPAQVDSHNARIAPRTSSLAVGDRVPDFLLLDQYEREVSSVELTSGQGSVLIFLPGVESPGARPVYQWAARHQRFLEQQGLEVILVSPQDPPLNARAAQEWDLRLGILSDPASWVARGFGIVPEGRRHPSSAHLFLLGRDGRLHVAGSSLPPPSDLVMAAQTLPGRGRDPFFSF